MVFSVLAVPVAAADQTTATTTATTSATVTQPATTSDAANFLASKKLLLGDDSGNLMLDKELTREEMVVILSRLMGQESIAKTYPTDNMTFADVPAGDAYAPYIAWAQDNMITQGYDETTFGFGQSLTAEQTKLFFARVLGYTNLTDAEQLAKADEVGITAGSTADNNTAIKRADMALLMSNTVYAKTSAGVVLGEELKVLEPAQPPVAALEVASATVVAPDSVKVTFNRAVADTSKLTFAVTGPVAVQPTVAWNDAKTEATLKAPSTLLDGAYSVKVAGDTFADGKDTASFVAVKNGIAKIQIASDKLVKATPTTGTFTFKLTDNYGNDITQTYSGDLKIVSSVGDGTVTDPQKGIATITRAVTNPNWLVNPATPETVAVTVISQTTAVTAAATLTVSDFSKVDTMTLGAVTFPVTTPATTRVLTNVPTAAYIAVNAVDQYGNVITNTVKLDGTNASDVMYVISDSTVTVVPETTTDVNGNTIARLRVSTSGVTAAETVTVSAISRSTGKSTSVTLNVQKAAQPDKITLLPAKTLVAAGDNDATMVIPMVVTDQYGTQLSASDIVSDASGFTFGGDFQNANLSDPAKTKLKIATSGPNAGCIVNSGSVVASSKGTRVLTVSYSGASTIGNETVTINDVAYPRTITVANTPATTLLQGSTSKVYYSFVDQYGRTMSLSNLQNFATSITNSTSPITIIAANGYQVRFTLTGTDYLTLAGVALDATTHQAVATAATVGDQNNMLSVGVTGSTAGSGTVKAELLDSTGSNVVSTVQTTYTTVMGAPSSLTYSIDDVPTLAAVYTNGNGAGGAGTNDINYGTYSPAVAGNAQYAAVLNVTAKDSNGTVYAIPSSRILSVSSTDPTAVQAVLSAPATAAIANQQAKMVVYGLSTAFQNTDAVGATKSATVTVLVSNDAGVQQITKTITIAKQGSTVPTTKSVVFVDKALDVTNPYAIPSTANAVTDLVGSAADIAAQNVYVYTLDNYGVYRQDNSATFKIANPDKFTGNVTYTKPQILFSDAQAQANQDVYLMYQSGSVYNQLRLRDTNGVATLDTTAPAAPVVTAPVAINIANKAAYSVSGTAEAGSTVTVTLTSGVTVTGTATAVGGVYTVTVDTTTLTDGSVAISATAKDAATNVSPVATATATKDVTAPTVVSAVAADATHVTVTFSEAVAPGTIVLANLGGTTVPSAVTYVAGATTATVTVGNTTVGNTLTISTALTDVAGNPLAATYTKSF